MKKYFVQLLLLLLYQNTNRTLFSEQPNNKERMDINFVCYPKKKKKLLPGMNETMKAMPPISVKLVNLEIYKLGVFLWGGRICF